MTYDKSTITIDNNNIIRGTRCAYSIELRTYFELNAKELESIRKVTYKKLEAILIKKEIKQLHMILSYKDEKETLRLSYLSEVV